MRNISSVSLFFHLFSFPVSSLNMLGNSFLCGLLICDCGCDSDGDREVMDSDREVMDSER